MKWPWICGLICCCHKPCYLISSWRFSTKFFATIFPQFDLLPICNMELDSRSIISKCTRNVKHSKNKKQAKADTQHKKVCVREKFENTKKAKQHNGRVITLYWSANGHTGNAKSVEEKACQVMSHNCGMAREKDGDFKLLECMNLLLLLSSSSSPPPPLLWFEFICIDVIDAHKHAVLYFV